MIFEKIELHNFGIYRGTHRLTLDKQDGNKNITLVGGMNGRGKTTLLDAIFLTIYGKRSMPLIQDNVKNYSTLLRNYVNKSATDRWTYISVTINLEDDVSTRLVVTRRWVLRERGVTEELEVIKDNLVDKYLSDNWNYYVEEIIPFGISRFFFFDNEKIAQIADDESFNEIKDSIKAVMGVTTIDKLLADVQAVMKEKRSHAAKSDATGKLSELKEVEDSILEMEGRIAKIRMDRAGITPRLEKTLNNLDEAEQAFWKMGGNLGLKRDEIEDERTRLRIEEGEIKQRQLALAMNPAAPLILCRDLVSRAYNRAKEHEKKQAAKFSLPVIEELVQRITEKMESLEIDAITRLKISTLLEQEVSTYSELSDSLPENTIAPTALLLLEKLLDGGFSQFVSQRNTLIRQMEENESALLQIDSHLSNNAEKGNAVDVLARIRELDHQKMEYEAEIDRIDREFISLENQLEALNSRRSKIIKQLADVENTNDDNERILSYAAKTITVMSEFKLRLQRKKVKELEANITRCFKFLAQKETVVTRVEIDPVSLDIVLHDYQDGILLKSQLSAGEKQMFAISIIWGLALTSGYKLPVVIDTPMARLDSAHRYNFINKYLPHASAQVVVLSTDEEVYGQYLDQLKGYVNAYYTLKYDENEKSSSIIRGYFGEA